MFLCSLMWLRHFNVNIVVMKMHWSVRVVFSSHSNAVRALVCKVLTQSWLSADFIMTDCSHSACVCACVCASPCYLWARFRPKWLQLSSTHAMRERNMERRTQKITYRSKKDKKSYIAYQSWVVVWNYLCYKGYKIGCFDLNSTFEHF